MENKNETEKKGFLNKVKEKIKNDPIESGFYIIGSVAIGLIAHKSIKNEKVRTNIYRESCKKMVDNLPKYTDGFVDGVKNGAVKMVEDINK